MQVKPTLAIVLALSASGAAAASTCRSPDPTTQERHARARALFKEKRYAEAQREACGVADALCLDTAAPAASYDLCAKAALMNGQPGLALERLHTIHDRSWDFPPAYVTEGTLWQLRQEPTLARAAFQTYLSVAPEAPDRAAVQAQVAALAAPPPAAPARPAAAPPAEPESRAAALAFFDLLARRDAALLRRSMAAPFHYDGRLLVPEDPKDPCARAARPADAAAVPAAARCLSQAAQVSDAARALQRAGKVVAADLQRLPPALRRLRGAAAALGPGHFFLAATVLIDEEVHLLIATRRDPAGVVVDGLFATVKE